MATKKILRFCKSANLFRKSLLISKMAAKWPEGRYYDLNCHSNIQQQWKNISEKCFIYFFFVIFLFSGYLYMQTFCDVYLYSLYIYANFSPHIYFVKIQEKQKFLKGIRFLYSFFFFAPYRYYIDIFKCAISFSTKKNITKQKRYKF